MIFKIQFVISSFRLTFLLSVTANSSSCFSTLSLMFVRRFDLLILFGKRCRCLTLGVLMRNERKRQTDEGIRISSSHCQYVACNLVAVLPHICQ